MALIEEFDRTGNTLFRYRSYIPVLMYILAFLVLWLDPANFIDPEDVRTGYLCVGISVAGMIIRFLVIGFVPKATSGRNTEKQVAETVNTKGIYGLVRHPLYLGNYFMWLGIIVYVGNAWFIIVASLLYWLYYERIIFAEEMFMRNKFGDRYLKWAENVPAFLPKLNGWVQPDAYFSVKNILKREYSGILATAVSFLALNALKYYFQRGSFHVDMAWVYVFTAALVFTLILKVMRKMDLLEVKGR
jgi:protein-S-isoprenylcysteine O-methyltransferase Ste14